MKLTIFGTGYVGLVTGACLADVGHQVMCVDVDISKIEKLKSGVIPIYEPGLEKLVADNAARGTLHFTTSAKEGVEFGDVVFIAVGTPPDENGSADLQYVLAVADTVGQFMPASRIVVNKSTVPVGTADKVRATINAALITRGEQHAFDVLSNPEFLKEGAAIEDFMRPDRIVIGTDSKSAEAIMRKVYAPFNRNHDRMIIMDIRSAELTKYAANAMLATKISFMNEIANIAERVGADIEQVRGGIGSDPRIGYHFIYAGCGYGGSCFPKDVQALAKTAKEVGYESSLLERVEGVNTQQKQKLFNLIIKHFKGEENLAGRTLAIWGLSFKPNTDDMRDAPSRVLMESLWRVGVKVKAYDPVAMDEVQRIYGVRDDLNLMGTKEAALQDADALVICTEWKAFRIPNFESLNQLRNKVIFDGRNIYDPQQMKEKGWTYYGIGRGETCRIE
ncbi:MAG: UDP-glucose/GDP-mannose dehydrogenase family protein [Oxalobacter sp.]|nr:MAG: UDP-glucose/GDP-mannose dehydrogenase family protein [Oxalobacter sp.]